MSVKMHILPELGLSYLHYTGHVTAAEMGFSLSACTNHPDFRSHFRHIADLSGVTSFENDYVSIMKVQAQAVGMLRGTNQPASCIFLCPTIVAQTFTNIVARSWEGSDDPIILIFAEAEQVDSYLGLPHVTVAQLNAAAKPLDMQGISESLPR